MAGSDDVSAPGDNRLPWSPAAPYSAVAYSAPPRWATEGAGLTGAPPRVACFDYGVRGCWSAGRAAGRQGNEPVARGTCQDQRRHRALGQLSWLTTSTEVCRRCGNHDKRPIGRPRSGRVDHLECLGEVALGQAALRCRPGQPAAQELLQVVHMPGLALVRAQRRDLAAEGVGDVHVLVEGWPALHPHLTDRPGLEALLGAQFRERERI